MSEDQSEAKFERVPPAAEPHGGSPQESAFRLGNDAGHEWHLVDPFSDEAVSQLPFGMGTIRDNEMTLFTCSQI